MGTIETSSEKINLWTCCKRKIVGFKGQCEPEDFISISSKACLPFQSLSAMFLVHALSLNWGTLASEWFSWLSWPFYRLELLILPTAIYCLEMRTYFCSSLDWFTLPLCTCKIQRYGRCFNNSNNNNNYNDNNDKNSKWNVLERHSKWGFRGYLYILNLWCSKMKQPQKR